MKLNKDQLQALAGDAALLEVKDAAVLALQYIFIDENVDFGKIIKRYERKFGKLDEATRTKAVKLLWKHHAIWQRKHLNHFIRTIKQSDGAD